MNSIFAGIRRCQKPLARLASAVLAFIVCAAATAATGALSWVAPTQNTDGSPLTDLASYRAYFGCGDESGYPDSQDFPGDVTTGVIEDLPDGETCRFVLVAINAAGVQSDYSNEVSKSFPAIPPADPVEIPRIEWRAAGVKMAEARFAFQSTTAPAGNWNYIVTTNPISFAAVALIDIDTGEETGWTLAGTEVGPVGDSDSGVNSAGTGDAAWVDQAVISQELWFASGATSGYDLTFAGLDAGKTYTIELYGSITSNGRVLAATLGDDTQTLNCTGNTSEVIRFAEISPDENGEILLSWRRADSSSGSAPLNALRIIEDEGGAQGEQGDFTAGSSLGSAFSAIATAAGAITAGVGISAAVSARAAAVASITEALEAGDTDSAAQAAQRVFAAQVSTDAQYAAIAQAAAAIQAGLEAGEVWAAIAAAEAGLIAGAELGATFVADTESAQTAALEAGTEAAAQFLGAVAAFGLLEAGASAADAFAASARIGASVSSAAQLGASFTTASLNDAVFSAAASLQSAFASEAAAIANFSAQASVDDAYSAISVALAAISIGVVLGATFSATSSADVSIVGATASVRAIRRLSATVRAIRPTATLN